ncbi:MAG: hypothetical protein JXR94_16710 [Candidatus Hydrogenedentes bacterium]|nr:hypothetical protein [Candidatus Hydrogenedentota bacterium]
MESSIRWRNRLCPRAALIAGVLMALAAAAPAPVEAATVSIDADTWTLASDILCVTLTPTQGRIDVLDKRNGHQWSQAGPDGGGGGPDFTAPNAVSGPTPGVAFECAFSASDGASYALSVRVTLPEGGADMAIEVDAADRGMTIAAFNFLHGFVLDAPAAALAVPTSNGHLYPLDGTPLPRTHFTADRLDMPWLGLFDLEGGMGYALIMETSDDALVNLDTYRLGERTTRAPRVTWRSSMGTFGYPRRVLYRFVDGGGYVALAKAYRAYAEEHGLLVTLAAKAEKNPNLERLFGAPDVWGRTGISFAREAKAAGVDRMLIHGRCAPEELRAINDLGFLTSEYDNYCDILPLEEGEEPDKNHDVLPDAAVLKADGERMTAWLTWDKKTQYMKRSPALWVRTAQLTVPKLLEEHPFNARFIDVTTAESLYEDYDPNHRLTRGDKRVCGQELLGYMRSLGLVTGGEHGIWWGVPHLDYIEGMMSGGYAAWPAGHLIRPKSKDEEFPGSATWDMYETWGIGHAFRVPLWELVFHDCVVSTWYWGDSSDFLLEAAPEITAKKDAFNILYGTIPLMWAHQAGAWTADRGAFMRTYRNTCKLHEAVATAELVTHEFVTPDRHVQRTRFSDGTEVVVNFGPGAREATLAGQAYLLPQNGFAVKGPQIEQCLELVDGRPVTTIRTAHYAFSDAGGREVTLRKLGGDTLRAELAPVEGRGVGSEALPVAALAPDWDWDSTCVFSLGQDGERLGSLAWRRTDAGLEVLATGGARRFEAVCRDAAAQPDLEVVRGSVSVTPGTPRQGEPCTVGARVANRGGAAAEGVALAAYVDTPGAERKLAGCTLALAAGEERAVTFEIDTEALDGDRRVVLVLDPGEDVAELCERDNIASSPLYIRPDLGRWPHRAMVQVANESDARTDAVAECALDLAGADAASVRVVECDAAGTVAEGARFVPAQYDSGGLCFVVPGETAAGARRRFAVLWADSTGDGARPLFPPRASMWDESAGTVTGATYRLRLDSGAVTDLSAGPGDKPFISSVILSSKETGWTDEHGTIESLEVVDIGPVRTRIRVRKALSAGVVYEKEYCFYPRYFDVSVSVSGPAGGLYSRAYYLRQATYEDDQGHRALIDGEGAAEEVYGKAKHPKWYAAYAEDWAHCCIALTPFDHIAYWDADAWGGIGLEGPDPPGPCRMRYAIHGGAEDAGFAAADYEEAGHPLRATAE